MKKKLSIFILLISLTFSVKATNYYFSSVSGNDLNSGSFLSPWRTLSKLNSVFASRLPGDSLLLKRGETFFGAITISRSGTISLPIVIGAYGTGARPIITSLVTLGTPVETFAGSHIWVFPSNNSLLSTVNIVLQAGQLKPLGRYPNLSAVNKGYLTLESHSGDSTITDNQLPLSPNWTGAMALIRRDQTNFEEGIIYSQSNTTLKFYPKLYRAPINNYGYYFQKDPKTLDEPGEWYYKASTKQIYFYSLTMPTGVQASSINTLVTSTSFSYITFTGIEFKGANADAFNLGVLSGSGGAGIKIKDCDIYFSGGSAVANSRHDKLNVIGCRIDYSLLKGITAGHDAVVRNCIITNTRPFSGMGNDFASTSNGTAILAFGNKDTIENNVIRYCGWSGMYVDGDNSIIRYNVIDSVGMNSNDCGAIYMGPATERHGIQIYGNILHGGGNAVEGGIYPTNRQTVGVYPDNVSSNNNIYSNSISDFQWGILLHNGDSNIVRNNTCYDNAIGLFVLSDVTSPVMRGNVFRGNTFFAKTASQFAMYLKTINSDINLLGAFDSNYYCRPIFEPQGIANAGTAASGGTIIATRGTTGYYSLDKWKAYQPTFDIHSKISPKGYDTIRYEVNTSYRDSVITLNYGNRDYTWLMANGARVKGTYTLPAFTAMPSPMIKDTIVPVAVVPNIKPVVSVTAPAAGATYVAPGTVNIAATATDADGTITGVNFYSGSTRIGSDASSPYTLTWTGVTPGGYSITAVARDNSGDSTRSAAIAVTVTSPIVPNIPPVVNITSPVNNTAFTTPATIVLDVEATDADDSILVVNFYGPSGYLGSDSSRPYSLTTDGYTTGSYAFFARARDYAGDSTTSAGITITVSDPPALAITVNSSAILCSGGQTTITIGSTGGTGTVTGSIGTYVVSAGTYTYIIADDLIEDTAIVTISQPSPVIVTDSIGVITAYGGNTIALISATGGTGSYQYQLCNGSACGFWQASNSFVIIAGNYTVYVKDSNGCQGSSSFSVTQPTAPSNAQPHKKKHYNY